MIALNSALAPAAFEGLEIRIAPGKFFINGSVIATPPTLIFVQPNTTNYIYLDFGGGTIGLNQSGYPAAELPICVVTADYEKILIVRDDRPDFSTVTSGGSSPHFVDGEVPSGAINGSNADFTLANSPSPVASLILTLNGVLQTQGTNYTLLGQTVIFTNPPVSGDKLLAFYRY